MNQSNTTKVLYCSQEEGLIKILRDISSSRNLDYFYLIKDFANEYTVHRWQSAIVLKGGNDWEIMGLLRQYADTGVWAVVQRTLRDMRVKVPENYGVAKVRDKVINCL